MIIIGSHALSKYIPLSRKKSDIDIIGKIDDINKFVKNLPGDLRISRPFNDGKKYYFLKNNTHIEAEIAWQNTSASMFLDIMKSSGYNEYASLNGLYTLKMSHRFLKRSPHFRKTMDDIHLMRKLGANITSDLDEFLKIREKETYNYSHPNLNQNKKDFFSGDGINYVYDHDSIHEIMKIGDRPAYTYFKPKNNEVKVDKRMFFDLDYEIQIRSVLEETYVLAIERSQVPYRGNISPKTSFDIALEKVCTSITSGWWREFAWENYYVAQSRYDDDYVNKFFKAVEDNRVRIIS